MIVVVRRKRFTGGAEVLIGELDGLDGESLKVCSAEEI